MFDITKDQLLRFPGAYLRELVARLCEAEIRGKGARVSDLMWGGDENAPDGGLDIEISIENRDFVGDFVQRARTGIQVKKSKMPPSKIKAEMCPNGQLRPIISELAENNGCYIIVSLEDDPAAPSLATRRKAMQVQVEATRNQGDLSTKFYGLNDLANWLRQHPGVQLWVRERLGLALPGWRPLGRWSATPRDVEDDLIIEDGVVIALPGKEMKKLNIAQGIDGIRRLIKNSGKTVRIVGLSGIGKTRIVQALFEEDVGTNPLDRSLAVYADLGEDPEPSARMVLERLIAENRSAIMILDNCPTETHNRLASHVSSLSGIHLVTVEFDIREDRPEATSVVRINAEGTTITELLVMRRYPDLGQVNARQIAEFSGGNARLALALADAVHEEDSLSSFSNTQLFDRLFYQQDELDRNFLMAAEVLALVYSFSISQDEGSVDELAILAELLNQNRHALHRATQMLVERQLAQKRGNWRAVLPHAVANKLAAQGLRNFPVDDIVNLFEKVPNARLLKSFGKRLGYLHDHEISQSIVKTWMSPGGLLHDLRKVNGDRIQLLLNVAPAAPENVLSTIEAQDSGEETEIFFSRENPRFSTFVDLLVAIAYDPSLFKRCVVSLAKFALVAREEEFYDSVSDRLFNLFALYLSGTEAGLDVREAVIRRFLSSGIRNEQRLGLGMLGVALNSRDWTSMHTFEFGARPRSYGYHPETFAEQHQWFVRFIALAQETAATKDVEISGQARGLLANKLRNLWHYPALREMLADMAKSLNYQRPWLEGWRAIRSIKHYNYRESDDETLDGAELLNELDGALRPQRLSDEIRNYVLSSILELYKLDDKFDMNDYHKWQQFRNHVAARAHDLGMVVADNPDVMDELSLEFFTAKSDFLFEFGEGMASKSTDLITLWERLIEGLELAGNDAHGCHILCGILKVIHAHDEPLAQKLLDKAVENCMLRKFIVPLQASIPFDHSGVNRLHRSLDFEDTPLWQFNRLIFHNPFNTLSEADTCDLMLKILDRSGGVRVIIDGLSIRFHGLKDDKSAMNPNFKKISLIAAAESLRCRPAYDDIELDHQLSTVLKSCMDESELSEETSDVIEAYFTHLRSSYGYVGNIGKTVAALVEKAPLQFLDRIFFDTTLKDYHRHKVFKELHHKKNPLFNVDVVTLMNWCRQGEFQERLTMISKVVFPFEKEPEGERIVLSGQARAIIDAAQNPSTIISNFSESILPSGWMGSLADIIAERCRAFETLLEHDRSDVRSAALTQIACIREQEVQVRQRERNEDEQLEQRFE